MILAVSNTMDKWWYIYIRGFQEHKQATAILNMDVLQIWCRVRVANQNRALQHSSTFSKFKTGKKQTMPQYIVRWDNYKEKSEHDAHRSREDYVNLEGEGERGGYL